MDVKQLKLDNLFLLNLYRLDVDAWWKIKHDGSCSCLIVICGKVLICLKCLWILYYFVAVFEVTMEFVIIISTKYIH